MAETRIIKCQAWVSGNSLVQDQILITSDGKSSENTVVLIQNIWDDLTDPSGDHNYRTNNTENTYKTNGKGYFYWEVDTTSMEDDDITVKVNIECPKPDVNIDPFKNPEPNDQWTPSEISGNYAKYWIVKLDKIMKDAENEYAIQRKEVIFDGTSYSRQDQTLPEGETDWNITLPDYTFTNSDLGDITNLLSMF